MNTALQIIGALTILAVVVAVVLGTWCGLEEVRERRALRIRAQARALAHREIGQYIIACSWWFEDRKACEAVKAIGQYMGENGLIDERSVREAWRKSCAEIAAPSQEGG
jgi:hypothetical protein